MLKNIYFLRELETAYYQLFINKRMPINLESGIISFAFDDVRSSAYENGVPLLDKYGIKATFYVATGLSDKLSEKYIKIADIEKLHESGHHIACHTYSHYSLKKGNTHELVTDAIKNIERLHNITGGEAIEHFSYPFGTINFKAKKLLSQIYKTMRSSQPGINKSIINLYLLRATCIYNSSYNEQYLKNIIMEAVRSRGWLIFYTHGVDQNPDDFSCTPEQLNYLLEASVNSSAEILPVDRAYKKIMGL